MKRRTPHFILFALLAPSVLSLCTLSAHAGKPSPADVIRQARERMEQRRQELENRNNQPAPTPQPTPDSASQPTPQPTPDSTPRPEPTPWPTPRYEPTPRPTPTDADREERRLRERLERERERRYDAERALQNQSWLQQLREDELRRQRDNLSFEQLRLRNDLSARESQFLDLQQQRDYNHNRELQNLQVAVNALTSQAELLQNERARLQNERDDAIQNINSLSQQLGDAQNNSQNARDQLASMQNVHGALKTENATLQILLEKQTNELKKLRAVAAQRKTVSQRKIAKPVVRPKKSAKPVAVLRRASFSKR